MRKKRILLADDETNFSEPLKSMMESSGYIVDLAANGVEAVLMSVENEYDMALIDAGMPKLNGINAVRILKKMNGRLPIIVFSGGLEHERISDTIHAGALMFVHKPFAANWLISQIRWVIGD